MTDHHALMPLIHGSFLMSEAIAWVCYFLCAALALMASRGALRLRREGLSPPRALQALGAGALALASLCAGIFPSLLGT